MNDDLISRNALLELANQEGAYGYVDAAQIAKQPTAYDVEAVCEQIKKVGAIDRRGMIHMQAALEIVQKGGNTNEH